MKLVKMSRLQSTQNRRHNKRRGDRGQATIEMIGVIPLAALITGAIIQLFMVGYGAVAAESAARLAAREASKGTSHQQAEVMGADNVIGIFEASARVANGDLSRGGDEPSVDGGFASNSVSSEVTVTVPFLGIGVPNLNIEITRYAVMPVTED